jgi:ankyrin repeat protein
LHEACASGNAQLVVELLNNGAQIEQRDDQGLTPLHVAAHHGTLKCVRIVIQQGIIVLSSFRFDSRFFNRSGAKIDVQDQLGRSIAHYCAMHDHLNTLKYLVEDKRIDLTLTDRHGKWPIHYAARYAGKSVLLYFLRAHLHIDARDQHGNTIGHDACEGDHLECVKMIWKWHRNALQSKNQLGRTPVHTVRITMNST